jgi:hypothetical protein
MTDEQQGMLNLDEMLGRTGMKVRYQGKEYPLKDVRALTPEEFGRVMAYGEKFRTLTGTEMQHNGGLTVMKAIEDVLEIIAPSLPRYQPTWKEAFKKSYKRRFVLGLQECVSVLNFWTEQLKQNSPNARRAAPARKRHPKNST